MIDSERSTRQEAGAKLAWPLAVLFRFGGWITGAPRQRKVSPVRLWSTRGIACLFIVWLFVLGPGNFLLPYHYGFSSTSEAGITVHFQDGVTAETVDAVEAYARSARAQALGFWGQPPGGDRPISIFLFPSQSRYKQFTLGSDGNASCAGSNLFLNPEGIGHHNLEPIIRHEMSHAIARQHVGYLGGFALPAWMDEGIATYLGTPSWASPQSLRKHLHNIPLPQVVSSTDMNSTLQWSNAASQLGLVTVEYAYARCLVEYLIQEYGQDKVRSFMLGASFFEDNNRRFQSTFGLDLREVEEAWLAEEKAQNHLPENTTIVAGVMSPGVVVLHWVKYAFLLACLLWSLRQAGRLLRLLLPRVVGRAHRQDGRSPAT
jgi:hypothetical protein